MRLGMIMAALLIGVPGAALAQRQGEVEVAASGESRLLAEQREDALCLEIEYPRGGGDVCSPRVTVQEPAVAGLRGVVGGAVAREVTRVEIEWPDGFRQAVEPVANEAFAGLRFFIAERGRRAPWLLRYFGADGTLLAATQEGDWPLLGTRTILASGRRWRVSAWFERVLAPGPGAPDRTEIVACLERRAGSGTGTRCTDGEPSFVAPINGDVFATRGSAYPRKAPHRLVLSALLGPGAATVDVDLGDGRRVRPRVRDLRAGDASARVVTYLVPKRSAVRRVIVRDAQGDKIDQQVVALAPGTLGDDGHGALMSARPPLGGAPQVAAGPVQDGEGILQVREIGARLCAEVEGSSPGDVPCGLLPRSASDSLLVGGGTEHHGVVGGVVPPEVAQVELEELLGHPGHPPQTVRVATHAPAPYAGAFAPHVRTFAALLPMGGLVRARLLDAEGRQLFDDTLDAGFWDGTSKPSRARTRLRIGRLRLLAPRADTDCVHVRDAGARLLHQTCALGPDEIQAHVVCRPAASVVVLSSKDRRDLVVRTARGRRIRPHRLRLSGIRHAVFVVPAPDAPRAVRWRGGRVALGPVQSPREQCGYEVRRRLT